jgi:hypothetical protein
VKAQTSWLYVYAWVSICQTIQCYILKDNKININKDIKKTHHLSLRSFIINIIGDVTTCRSPKGPFSGNLRRGTLLWVVYIKMRSHSYN